MYLLSIQFVLDLEEPRHVQDLLRHLRWDLLRHLRWDLLRYDLHPPDNRKDTPKHLIIVLQYALLVTLVP